VFNEGFNKPFMFVNETASLVPLAYAIALELRI